MSTTQSSPTTDTTAADSLREVADWLDQHPGQRVRWGFIRMAADDRAAMEALGAALGALATEKVAHGDVYIGRQFGEIEVYAELDLRKVGWTEPLTPTYPPILATREAVSS